MRLQDCGPGAFNMITFSLHILRLLFYHSLRKKNNNLYVFLQLMPCNERACICWAFHKPLSHKECISILLGMSGGVKPGTHVRTWLIDGAVRHTALGLAKRQLLADRCGKVLPATFTVPSCGTGQSHRTGPKALAPWVLLHVRPRGEVTGFRIG